MRFLRLDGDDDAPAGHVPRPLDAVDADVGAAIDRDDAVAIAAAAQIEQREQQCNVGRIVGGVLEELETDTEAGIVRPPIFVKAIDDHRAMFGRGQDKRELTRWIGHWAGAASADALLTAANHIAYAARCSAVRESQSTGCRQIERA